MKTDQGAKLKRRIIGLTLATAALLSMAAKCPAPGVPQAHETAGTCEDRARDTDMSCWPTTFSPPGTGIQAIAAKHGHYRPGTIHTVNAQFDVYDHTGQPVNWHVYVVCRALAGKSLAINTETGLPFIDQAGITTEDVVQYETGEGVTTLEITGASLLEPGQALQIHVRLDGVLMAPTSSWIQVVPMKIAGRTRMASVHATVSLPTL